MIAGSKCASIGNRYSHCEGSGIYLFCRTKAEIRSTPPHHERGVTTALSDNVQSVYYNSLGSSKHLYDTILQSIRNGSRMIPIAGPVNANELVTQVFFDHPELFFATPGHGTVVSLLGSAITPFYPYSQAEASRLKAQLESVSDQIIHELINDHQSDYDKVRVLHDYLKYNLQYDNDAVGSLPVTREFAEAHNIVGALLHHKCVCDGFSKAFKYLCNKAGVECWVIHGKGSSSIGSEFHAWNIVKINGYYHHVDVTWDNQYAASALIPNYGYLNLSDEEISKDHTWNRKHYPACPDSPYNYFRVNDSLIDSKTQLINFLRRNIQMEEAVIMFRVVRGSPLEKEVMGCLDDCIYRASANNKYVSITSWQHQYIPEQLTHMIEPTYILR